MAKLKTYRVTGYVTITVELDVDARSVDEAIENAKEELQESYGLDQSDLFHDINNGLEFDLDTLEYEDEESSEFDD